MPRRSSTALFYGSVECVELGSRLVVPGGEPRNAMPLWRHSKVVRLASGAPVKRGEEAWEEVVR
jgi:hypothetical protein